MSDRRDDDALAWAGDDDPTLAPVVSPIAGDAPDDEITELPEASAAAVSAPTERATPPAGGSAASAAPASASDGSAATARAATVPDAIVAASTSAAAPAAASAAPATAPARRTVLDEAEEAEDRAVDKELAEAEAASKQLSSPALIGMGILGGVYLLYTIGWIVSFSRYQTPLTVDFSVVSYRITLALAIAATPLWFVGTLLLTQAKDIRFRFLWLVIGVLVLVPWPFLMGV
ncbi:hypothetical protein [Herbiconiux ginsengi]|uniref:DNA polymerase III subunit gamma/tau n=1 Tax=Herbiconiux ginsengi TaxID=381665 RepID=A0A1H3T151_9MICO|nr:hypothetical protein [Herbiconiux ginsengi]SDZ43069.1 hypothetical protein SAMN05216554_3828 [Herbiconiux ginsengi]